MAKNVEKHTLTRIAIVNPEKCRPNDCNLECEKSCPINKTGKPCITINKDLNSPKPKPQAVIEESLCIGCSACVKACPFKAISIVNLPSSLTKNTIHRFGKNGFKLHRLPILKNNKIIGMVGINGVGKSTAMKILSNDLHMNFGDYTKHKKWTEIINYFKGSELQKYFKELIDYKRVVDTKIQYIDFNIDEWCEDNENITVNELLELKNKDFENIQEINTKDIENKQEIEKLLEDLKFEFKIRNTKEDLILRYKILKYLEIEPIRNKKVKTLSGGELQRVSIAKCLLSDSNTFFLDEPTSFLDVKQRLNLANLLQEIINYKDFEILLIDHDLAFLDLSSDLGHIIYGKSGQYGIISSPFSIKQAINIFLDGYLPTENMKFGKSLVFERKEHIEVKRQFLLEYPSINYKVEDFKLKINKGNFSTSEIILLLGENGTGKTTFLNILSGNKKDKNIKIDVDFDSNFKISYKKQTIKPNLDIKLKDLLKKKVVMDEFVRTQIYPHLNLEYLLNEKLTNLSGGELQRVAILLCLAKNADIYLIDEPSAYLDAEQRIKISKIIRKFCYYTKKTIFIVEHDMIMATYLADKIINFSGMPGKNCIAEEPVGLEVGMNKFLKSVNVTFRRDPTNNRPRVNKKNSIKDREQKEIGKYFY